MRILISSKLGRILIGSWISWKKKSIRILMAIPNDYGLGDLVKEVFKLHK